MTTRSSARSVLMMKIRAVPATVRTALDGTRMPGRLVASSICAVAKKPGFNRPCGLGTIASSVSARVDATTEGETKRTCPRERFIGIGIYLELHRASGGHCRHILFGHGQLDPQRIDPHH